MPTFKADDSREQRTLTADPSTLTIDSLESPRARSRRVRITAGWAITVLASVLLFLVLPELRGGSAQDFAIFGLFGLMGLAFNLWAISRYAAGETEPEPLPPGPFERA